MAVDLHSRAMTQRDALLVVVNQINDELAEARQESTRRHPDPEAVAQADWSTEFGASQHLDVARDELANALEEEDAARKALAAIENPGDAETHEAALRAVLISLAGLQVEVRVATERKAATDAEMAELSRLVDDARTALEAAEDGVDWAKEHRDHTTALIDALAAAPLDSVVADATALELGSLVAARDRMEALLPASLFERANQRHLEANAVVDEAFDHAESARTALAAHEAAATPLATAVAAARRDYLEAEKALTFYVNSAALRLADTERSLEAIGAYPDLTAGQTAALNPDDPSELIAAVDDEAALAVALASLGVAQRALDDEVLAELLGDPAADPASAEAARDAVLNDDVTPARADYDQADRDALDSWEVEVPSDLWRALHDLNLAERDLGELSDATTTTTLTDDLGAAEDALGPALDAYDDAVRMRLSAALAASPRVGAVAAARRTAHDRQLQYLRGDGPSGRAAAEL